MMWASGWWGPGPWMFPWMFIFPLIFLGVVLFVVLRVGSGSMCGGRRHRSDPSAREILDRRYARGEISRDEYQHMKKDLE